ncbi:MAG TPA: hypothetical protein VK668_24180 [Mucilaginibacter sp.]|nr:hypothetical protein [Mucilaginibacter sp.]
MMHFLDNSSHVLLILVIGLFVVMCVLAASGKFDHWKSRFIRRSERGLQRKRKLKDE